MLETKFYFEDGSNRKDILNDVFPDNPHFIIGELEDPLIYFDCSKKEFTFRDGNRVITISLTQIMTMIEESKITKANIEILGERSDILKEGTDKLAETVKMMMDHVNNFEIRMTILESK